jgi:endonuclease/exonuclease/phosphatase family metal-dependent hydrolase
VIPKSVIALVAVLAAAGCVSHNLSPQPEFFAPSHVRQNGASREHHHSLRLLSVNLAHGRGNGFHQALQGDDKARTNLDAIESLISRESPDVVAFQEADAPSAWSGRFDHVDYVARAAKYGWGMHTAHAEGLGLAYGTAVLSRLPIEEHAAHTFVPARASLPKGFSLATVRWQRHGMEIDVVSLHMEPLREEIRKRQAEELISALADRGRPLILMGDFNTEWHSSDGVLQRLVAALDLTAWSPDSEEIITYPRLDRRLDWILVSRPLRFTAFEVLDDAVSDHRAIVADIELDSDFVLSRASQ